jgi:hypothetical protein
VYWLHASESSEEMLVVSHKDHRGDEPSFSLSQVQTMLAESDFSRIPCFTPDAAPQLQAALTEFAQDVQAES